MPEFLCDRPFYAGVVVGIVVGLIIVGLIVGVIALFWLIGNMIGPFK
jgi:mannose/fructose/N-acetylgalactosamine-specific phosphotransferase system component IIC